MRCARMASMSAGFAAAEGMDGHMEVTTAYATRESWYRFFPIDGNGVPTSDAAYQLLLHLFENRDRTVRSEDIAEVLGLHRELVQTMCRQLELVFLVFQSPPASGEYQYALHTRNSDLQAKVESSLIDYPSVAARQGLPAQPPS